MSIRIFTNAFGRYWTKSSLLLLKSILSKASARASLDPDETHLAGWLYDEVNKLLKG